MDSEGRAYFSEPGPRRRREVAGFLPRRVSGRMCPAKTPRRFDKVFKVNSGNGAGRPAYFYWETLGCSSKCKTEPPMSWFAEPVQQVDSADFGCTLLSTRALRRMMKPWLHEQPDSEGRRSRRPAAVSAAVDSLLMMARPAGLARRPAAWRQVHLMAQENPKLRAAEEADPRTPPTRAPCRGPSAAEVVERFEMHPGSMASLSVLDELRDLHRSKAADYGSAGDPLKNIRSGAEFVGIEPWRAAMVRIADKVSRLGTHSRTGALRHEGVEDTLLDLASYSILSPALSRETETAETGSPSSEGKNSRTTKLTYLGSADSPSERPANA